MSSKPKFCPNCGVGLEGSLANVRCIDNDGTTVWDTYCKKCGWSGNISPDIEEVEK